ncbi:hypothetical protein ES332_A11G001500v1 [Gossypium tomentosum]|uniref:Neprosin PEP catalytic domain-containing protein n=1 Tax=Gossypium tomentosum TaxID=34277 RepID=A0A5D2N778_GOSTO|nr:hypothetical protein ES332_A11G001500v1 [Gossypium tomentosum]
MASSVSHNSFSTIPLFVGFLVVASSLAHFLSSPLMSESGNRQMKNHTFKPAEDIQKLRRINAYLKKINKPASPDGDIIDCVLSHLQPAFDHPVLRGQKPSDPPARPKRSGESCPEGTVPIRRTTEKDVLKASSVRRYGRTRRGHLRRDSTGSGHEDAVLFVNGDQYYGAKASLKVWAPHVTNEYEFSLSQIWIISGSFGNDLNTIEAETSKWCVKHELSAKPFSKLLSIINVQNSFVRPELYGDNYPRFFTYWTTDAYRATGCYNLLCSGFVQTTNKIAIGAAISPISSYDGRQFDIDIMVWKVVACTIPQSRTIQSLNGVN